MRRRLLLALLPALVLPACGGGGGIQKQSLSDLVLRRQDVGKRFVAFYSGRQTQLDTQGTPRSDQSRFGREGGWIARYRRSGAPAANGPLVIESRADLFSGSGGAGKDLELYRRQLASPPGSTRSRCSCRRSSSESLRARRTSRTTRRSKTGLSRHVEEAASGRPLPFR
jgi:hypothetical protein